MVKLVTHLVRDANRILARSVNIAVKQLEDVTKYSSSIGTVDFLDDEKIPFLRVLQCGYVRVEEEAEHELVVDLMVAFAVDAAIWFVSADVLD